MNFVNAIHVRAGWGDSSPNMKKAVTLCVRTNGYAHKITVLTNDDDTDDTRIMLGKEFPNPLLSFLLLKLGMDQWGRLHSCKEQNVTALL